MASNVSPTNSTTSEAEPRQVLTRNSSGLSDGAEVERDADNISLCFLCQKDFTVPKLLPCLHTLCRDCLVELARKNNGSETVACPQCRESDAIPVNSIETLLDNTLLLKYDDENVQDANASPVQCSFCNHGNAAVNRCGECVEFLCSGCTASHTKNIVLRQHKLISMDEWRKQVNKSDSFKDILCPQHNGEAISFYCETCKKPICKDCAVLDHKVPAHVTCSLLEGVVICRRTLEKLLIVSRQTEAKFKGAWEILNNMKSGLTETTTSLRGQVQAAFKSERDSLDERETGFLTKIDVIETQRAETIQTHIDKVENVLDKLWTAIDLTDVLMDSGNDYHVLNMQPTISGRLLSLYKAHPEIPPSDLTIIDLTEGYESEEEPETHQVKELAPEEGDEVEEGIRWELENTLGDRGSGEGQFDWCRGVASSLDNHTVVADWGNDRVQLFNPNGTFMCVLNTDNNERGRTSMPQDVACLLDGRLVVIDKSSYAKIYSADGRFLYHFTTVADGKPQNGVELSCVTVDRRSRILIGDAKRNVVTIHYVDGQLIKTVPAVGPEHIACTSRDLLVVSCPRKQKIRVMNHDGRFLFQMESFGAGEKLKPRGVACDEDDNIYVVHKERGGDKSVHMFNSIGKYVSCVVKHLREPYDVNIAPGGKVIVSDDDVVKIYIRKKYKIVLD